MPTVDFSIINVELVRQLAKVSDLICFAIFFKKEIQNSVNY